MKLVLTGSITATRFFSLSIRQFNQRSAIRHGGCETRLAAFTHRTLRRMNVKKNLSICLVLALAALMTPLSLNRTASAQNNNSLYKRLGGYDALAAVTDDFITALATDKKLGRFFVGASDNSKARIRQLVVDQLCAATGGPCLYIGRDMKASHKGLGITEEDWNIAVNLLVGTLKKFKVPEKEQKELAGALMTLKADIVEKP
jgi:hemoglobin